MKKTRTLEQLNYLKSSWYVDEEGALRWARKAVYKQIGDLVGLSNVKGKHRIAFLSIKGKLIHFVESNAIWYLYTGEWPTLEIDHIDGNPHNNKKDNLRLVTRSQQQMNRIAGKSGRQNKGVYKRDYGNKWSAQIWINGICKNLGTYTSEEEASEVRELATEMLHGKFANIKSYKEQLWDH